MKAGLGRIERTLSKLKTEKVMTINQLSSELGITSRNTRRHLKRWGAFTSYNHNGRFYAHPDVVRFNGAGLWRHNGVQFSRHGNLREAFVGLVENSESGMDGVEAGGMLRLNPRSFLSHFRDESRLRREKLGGRFIYFSSGQTIYGRQKNSRLAGMARRPMTDAAAVALLVEKIKRPSAEVSELVRGMAKHGVNVTAEEVTAFLERHGLLKKT